MIKPNRLKRGDKVAIVSLSSGMMGEKMFIHRFEIAKKRMEEDYGLKVIVMPHALKGIDFVYKHPKERAQDLMDAFKDKEIKAIFSAIGGADAIRILPYIDYDVIKNNPKIFTGFSDSTVNHLMMHKAGLVSYYGLSVMNDWSEYVEINPYSKDMMDKTLFNPCDKLDIPASTYYSDDDHRPNWGETHQNEKRVTLPNSGYELLQGKGIKQGELIGGCVEVLMECINTSLWPSLDDFKGKILLLETSDLDLSNEMLTIFLRNLHAQGILDVINGILVGRPAVSNKYNSYKKIFKKVVGIEAKLPELPILYNVNVGHAYPIGLFALGLPYEINCDNKSLTLLEPATK